MSARIHSGVLWIDGVRIYNSPSERLKKGLYNIGEGQATLNVTFNFEDESEFAPRLKFPCGVAFEVYASPDPSSENPISIPHLKYKKQLKAFEKAEKGMLRGSFYMNSPSRFPRIDFISFLRDLRKEKRESLSTEQARYDVGMLVIKKLYEKREEEPSFLEGVLDSFEIPQPQNVVEFRTSTTF